MRPTSIKIDLPRFGKNDKRDPCSSKETCINCKETYINEKRDTSMEIDLPRYSKYTKRDPCQSKETYKTD